LPTSLDQLASQHPGTASASAAQSSAQSAQASNATASTAGSESAQAAHAAHTGYNAQEGVVADNELAATQMDQITSRDSALMRRARTAANAFSNSRGMLNSSIAAGTAMGAMVDRAMPLAQQDAAARRQQALVNQDVMNRAREFEAQASNTAQMHNSQNQTNVNVQNAAQANEAARLNAQLGTDVSRQNAQNQTNVSVQNASEANETSRQNAQMQTQTSLANADADNRMRENIVQQNAELNRQWLAGTQSMDLASIQGRYQQLIASNESASSLYESFFQSISAAMANDQITPDRVAQYVRVQQSMLESGLRLIDSLNALDLNVSMPNVSSTGAGTHSSVTTAGPGTVAANPAPPTGFAPPNLNLEWGADVRLY
jgi:hypothetical protein